ncbi:MAG: mechanosensitive ion channel family protein [Candidatus Mariimomonas ferrooxydans]
MENILQISFLQNTILNYLIFLLTFLIGVFIVKILKSITLNRLKVWAEKSATTIDDFLIHIFDKKLLPLLYFGVFYLSTESLTLSPTLSKFIDGIGIVLLTFFSISLIVELLNYLLQNFWAKKDADANRERAVKTIFPILKVVTWGIGITFLLDNLGFKISAVVAGLGIGGIAVALAAQTILGDLFSYFVIFFDRPFEVGDFIIIDDFLGSIEQIGIKTTKIRSLGGEQLVFSNTDLTNSRLRNYKRMTNRRVVFKLGVTYQTSLQQLQEIPVIITNIIKNVNGSAFDRAHFSSYGDFSLVFEVVYYVIGGDYTKYMNIQQEINFKIKEEFEKRVIKFAYPTQTLFLEKSQEN